MCYFTALNICCRKKEIAQDRDNNALSLDSLIEDEYSFKFMFLDAYGEQARSLGYVEEANMISDLKEALSKTMDKEKSA